jgi:hypothetical protein
MISRFTKLLWFAAVANLALSIPLRAEILAATIQTSSPAETGYFKLGTTRNPAGHEINVNSRSLLFDGQPVFPVMGEIHYARVPQAEWREELLKMKAGGVDIVATYVFWIHHEEIQGQWDWNGQRDLKKFVQTCGEAGLKVVVRCGPWCHGEVRNGGFPDWVVAHKDWKLRSTDTNFLAATKTLYGEIAKQLQGGLWKDGGPVIGIQVDNEFGGNPAYLMALKQFALDAGIDVPLYAKTGWPAMKTPPPLGELLPLFGAYAEGFWERSLEPMAGNSWEKFTFKATRTDTGVGNDTLGNRKSGDTADTQKYPYLTCEIGGGMPPSYHRRINFDPRDVEAVALCQLGSGSSLMGYYMYHGGINPEGKLSTLQESLATGYPNDLPVKNYDFNAPLGSYGQKNPQYFWLRRLHLFLHDFGGQLAPMPATLPDIAPTKKSETNVLRWVVRSDGNSGYVFVNNYERLRPLPAKPDMQFKLNLPGGELVFPRKPVTIPADAFFFWLFNLDLDGVKLIYATAQPVCRDGDTFYFAETPGVKAEFVFDSQTLVGRASPRAVFENIKPGRKPAIKLATKAGQQIQIVLLSDADSLALAPGAPNSDSARWWPGSKHAGPETGTPQPSHPQIAFEGLPKFSATKVKTEALKSAGPAREIPVSTGKSRLPIAPSDDDFTNAAVWKITLPGDWNAGLRPGSDNPNMPGRRPALHVNPLLRIRYIGDVARLTLNGRLINDDFFTGRPFEIGLKRHAPEILTGDLRLEILPLRKDAPIFIEPKSRPDFGTNGTLLKLESVEIVQ